MQALLEFSRIVKDPLAKQEDKNEAKRLLRKVLIQVLRSTTELEDIESEDDSAPMSPYNPGDY